MNLVDEEHIVSLHGGEDCSDVAGPLNRGPAGRSQVDSQFPGHNPGQRGLAQPGRSVEQQVVQRFVPLPRGVDRDADCLVDGRLADELVQPGRTQCAVVAVDLRLGRVDHSSDGCALVAVVALRRHTARLRNALRLATASGCNGSPLFN